MFIAALLTIAKTGNNPNAYQRRADKQYAVPFDGLLLDHKGMKGCGWSLAESLPSTHRQGLDPMQAHACDPSTQKAKKDQRLKFTLLSDIVSSKSAWATRDPRVLVHTSRVNLESIIHMKETRFKGYIVYDFHSDGMSQTGKSRETQSGWVVVRARVARNF